MRAFFYTLSKAFLYAVCAYSGLEAQGADRIERRA